MCRGQLATISERIRSRKAAINHLETYAILWLLLRDPTDTTIWEGE